MNNHPDFQDSFILLSAYLDQETTYAEKQQVEERLSSDIQFRQLYRQQLRLRAGLRQAPVPQTALDPEQLAHRVIDQAQKRSRSRLFGATTLALLAIVAGVFTVNSRNRGLESGIANQPVPEESETLMIALERPIVPLPKALTNTTNSLQSK
jgi:predicted anti-sigma-YlaC factor YlaD